LGEFKNFGHCATELRSATDNQEISSTLTENLKYSLRRPLKSRWAEQSHASRRGESSGPLAGEKLKQI
jgi:hypothetical protein